QSATPHLGVLVDNPLATDGLECAFRCDYAMRFASAKPDPTSFVQVTKVPPSVADIASLITNLCKPVVLRPIKVFPRYVVTPHHDFPNLTVGYAELISPGLNRIISDGDYRQIDSFQGAAHADTLSF